MTQLRAGLRGLLARLTKRRYDLPADMYLRVDKVDPIVQALRGMQENIQTCANEIRNLSSTALPEVQLALSRRIAACGEAVARLQTSTKSATDDLSLQAVALNADTLEQRVQQGRDRKSRLLTFGPNAHGVIVKTKHGPFAVDPEDGGVSARLLGDGCYAESEYLLARSMVSKDGNVLIVGAHIGAFAVPLSRDCNKLIAIEANPQTFEYLEMNLLLNSCSNVLLLNIAASEKFEKIEFLLNTENSGGAKRKPLIDSIYYYYDKPRVIEIDAVPLDTLKLEDNFDLILMDIEGSEYFALRGMQKILSRSKALSVEFLPHHLECVAGVTVDDFISTILPHFNWMYIPALNQIVAHDEIATTLREMYQAGEGHDGIYFFKETSSKWLESRGLHGPKLDVCQQGEAPFAAISSGLRPTYSADVARAGSQQSSS